MYNAKFIEQVNAKQCDQIWRNFQRLWQSIKGFFCFGHNFEPTMAKNYTIWQSFVAVNGQN